MKLFARLCAVLLLSVPLTSGARAQFSTVSGAERARIEAAIAADRQRQQAENVAAQNQRIAGRIDALERNPGSPFLGAANANVTIVEFFDYTCPFCKAVEPRLAALLKADRRVKLVLKEYPILTPQSLTASRMALAAQAEGRYAPFHLAMMNLNGRLTDAGIDAAARSAGLDPARLRRQMYAPAVTDEIIANFNLARAIRAFQTPTFIVGGRLVTGDSADIDFPRLVAAARAGRR